MIRKRMIKMISIWTSPVVTHPSTIQTWRCLTSQIGRDAVRQRNMADHVYFDMFYLSIIVLFKNIKNHYLYADLYVVNYYRRSRSSKYSSRRVYSWKRIGLLHFGVDELCVTKVILLRSGVEKNINDSRPLGVIQDQDESKLFQG